MCAGTGAFSIVAEKLGFTTVYANDVNPISKLAYDANIRSCKLDCCPIQDVPLTEMPSDIALLTAGIPCTPYSKSGRRGGRSNPASFVFDYVIERAGRMRPRWVVFENVPDILKVWDELEKVVEQHLPDYRCKYYAKYNTRVHSELPQNRLRAYFVWFREQTDYNRFVFPTPTPPQRLVSDLLQPEDEVAPEFYYQNRTTESEFQIRMRTAQLEPVRTTQTVYKRWHKDMKPMVGSVPCLQANAKTTSNSLPVVSDGKGNRMITPLEAMRLQGFSDQYVRNLPAELTNDDRYFLAGNAVSLPIAELVLRALMMLGDR